MMVGRTKEMNITRRIVVSVGFVFLGLVPAPAVGADDVASLIKQLGAWSNNKAKKASDELTAMGKPVVPEVTKALSSRSRRRGRFAARTLRQIGPDAADAIPALFESLKDTDALTREYAVEALAAMVRQADRVIPVLQQVTSDPDEDVREQARLAIVRLTESLKSRDRTESAPQPPAETPSAETAAQSGGAADAVRQAASQPNSADVSNSSAVLAARRPEKEGLFAKLRPIIFMRFALIAFIVVGFFSLLYFYREHP